MTVLLVVRLTAKPGKGAALKELILPYVGDGGGIEGCSGIELAVDAGAPDRLLILERWTSVEAHKTHLAALQDAGGMDALLALVAEPPERSYYTQVPG